MQAPFDAATVAGVIDELEEQARTEMAAQGLDPAELTLKRSADLRYGLQVFEVEAPLPDGDLAGEEPMEKIVEAFESAYADRYGAGSGYAEAGVLLTALRVEARGVTARPALEAVTRHGGRDDAETERDVYWWELRERLATPIYAGGALTAGRSLDGPAVIEYPDTTAVVRPGQRAEVDALGSLVIHMEGAA
jgi:N-methylhydantoinase A